MARSNGNGTLDADAIEGALAVLAELESDGGGGRDSAGGGNDGGGGGRARTQFKPGNPGKPRGARNHATRVVEAMLDGHLEDVTQRLIKKALGWDLAAIRLFLDRAAPASKEPPIALDLPALDTIDDIAEASKRLIAALAAGDIVPGEATRVMALLACHRATLEAAEASAAEAAAAEADEVEAEELAADEEEPKVPTSLPAIRRLPRHMWID